MVYRDESFEPKIAELRALIATEPAVLEELTATCFAQDALVFEIDRLERELAASRGVVSSIKSLFASRSADRDAGNAARLSELEAGRRKRDESIARERLLSAQLQTIATAKQELLDLEEHARRELRTREGPLGDELRALFAIADDEAVAIARLQRLLVAGERVVDPLRGIADMLAEIRAEPELAQFTDTRHQQLVDRAVVGLRELAATITATSADELDVAWVTATSRYTHFVDDGASVIEAVDTAMSVWLTDRREREARRSQAIARARALADQALPRR